MQVLLEVFKYNTSTVHGRILTGKILVNDTGKSYWRGIGKVTVSAYAKYIFSVSVNNGKENLTNSSGFSKFTNFVPTKVFPCAVHIYKAVITYNY